LSQRERIGGEFVQLGIFEAKRRLNLPVHALLANDVGDVIGAESACGMSFRECFGDGLGSVLADQGE